MTAAIVSLLLLAALTAGISPLSAETALGGSSSESMTTTGAPPTAEPPAEQPASTILQLRHSLADFLALWPRLPEAFAGIAAILETGPLERFAIHVLVLLACGLAGAWLGSRAVKPGAPPAAGLTLRQRLMTGIRALPASLLMVPGWLLGIALASIILGIETPKDEALVAVVSDHGLIAIVIAIALDLLLAPRAPTRSVLDLAPLNHRQATRDLMTPVVGLMGVTILGQTLFISGMQADLAILLSVTAGSPFLAWAVLLPWVWRYRLKRLRAASPSRLPAVMASAYALLVWLSALGALMMGSRGISVRIILALLIPLAILLLARTLARLARERLAVPAEAMAAEAMAAGDEENGPQPGNGAPHGPTHAAQGSAAQVKQLITSARSIVTTIWTLAIIASALAYFHIFDLEMGGLVGINPSLMSALVEVGAIILAAHVFYTLAIASLDRRILMLDGPNAAGRAKRLRTLMPLLRWTMIIVIAVMAVLVGLSEFGVDIAPLIAGAGVFGLAFGLGTQKLVTDVVSGIFFLVDDAFSVGDYIEVDGKKGTVEAITARSMKLRHHMGPVHTVPFGHISSVTNNSRDWAIVRMEFRLPSDADLQRVKKIIKDIGKEIAADPEMAPNMLEPLKSQGVRRFENNTMILGVKFMAKPGTQFVIRRFAFQRIRDSFRAAGLEFFDSSVVVVRVDKDEQEMDAKTKAAVGAAAAQALPPG